MTTEKVFAKSNAKDVLALSKASAEAMLANFTITIVLAGTKTDDEVTPFIERLNTGHKGSWTTLANSESGYARVRVYRLAKQPGNTRNTSK
ncbi:CpaF/VirB11 family protein [Pseudomonas savastanoi]|uniref:CpaF/VirB11 family protein n=1 Tax=Pseudomonas savastanoi TaxID=29438 RepID=A0AAW5J9N7_PSESS|nr:CpaF/VirB11 family protein [Pseudomonas savastanoi]MCQ3023193.1 CpaF/VirB11 family protein [Pseudomonas savastanoi]